MTASITPLERIISTSLSTVGVSAGSSFMTCSKGFSTDFLRLSTRIVALAS